MLKRDAVKYVRDAAKSRYKKGSSCEICGTTESLEFHHYYGLTELLASWLKKNGYEPEDIVSVRDEFISSHQYELYDAAVTLCKKHHRDLHNRFGQRPRLSSAEKQRKWVENNAIKCSSG